jgi:hypothetical protein
MKYGVSRPKTLAVTVGVLLIIMLMILPNSASAQIDTKHFSLHGFVRGHFSMNLQDPPETEEDDAYDLSMVRGTLYLEANVFWDWGAITAIGRADKEYKTDYLQRLDDLSSIDLLGEYDRLDMREWYVDFFIGKRVTLRAGKQQVVWGKTDFFRGMDIIHGFDFTWRSFLEVENEQLRKPLILGNLQIEIPKAKGSLQLLVRPGWDRDKDIGNTYDLFGGRWANQPNKGVNFLEGVPYNWHHSSGDTDDPNYGFRWYGTLGKVEYSLAYYKTLNLDPVVNTIFNPFGDAPLNGFGEFIYPEVDMYGVSLNYYWPAPDMVIRTEISMTADQPYNIGTNFFDGALPGFGGVVQKNTVRTMLALDKQMRWAQKVLGASRPAFFNFQLFDTWLTDFDKNDDIVALAGFGAPINAHTTILTVILGWNYKNDRINPTIAAGVDATNGGGFVIPSVEFAWGNHWRLRLEADLFFNSGSKLPGEVEQDTYLFGYFANNNQLVSRLTFQF